MDPARRHRPPQTRGDLHPALGKDSYRWRPSPAHLLSPGGESYLQRPICCRLRLLGSTVSKRGESAISSAHFHNPDGSVIRKRPARNTARTWCFPIECNCVIAVGRGEARSSVRVRWYAGWRVAPPSYAPFAGEVCLGTSQIGSAYSAQDGASVHRAVSIDNTLTAPYHCMVSGR